MSIWWRLRKRAALLLLSIESGWKTSRYPYEGMLSVCKYATSRIGLVYQWDACNTFFRIGLYFLQAQMFVSRGHMIMLHSQHGVQEKLDLISVWGEPSFQQQFEIKSKSSIWRRVTDARYRTKYSKKQQSHIYYSVFFFPRWCDICVENHRCLSVRDLDERRVRRKQ